MLESPESFRPVAKTTAKGATVQPCGDPAGTNPDGAATATRPANRCLGLVQWLRTQRESLMPMLGPSQLEDACRMTTCLNIPMLQVSLGVCFVVWFLKLTPSGSEPFLSLMPHRESDGDSTSQRFLGALVNSLYMLSIVIAATLLFVFLFHFRLRRTLIGILAVFFSFVIGGAPAYLTYRGLQRWSAPFDWVTLIIPAYNFAAMGAVVIYWEVAFPRWETLRNLLLVLVAVALTWPFCCFAEWTVWCFLVVMVIWDLIAVLTPCGPLRYVMELHNSRILMADPFEMPPGMVYEGKLFRLGLGDFVFYGVVVGRAACADWATTCASILTMVAALGVTILITARSSAQALPALPVAIALGVLVYLWSRQCLHDFVLELGERALFV